MHHSTEFGGRNQRARWLGDLARAIDDAQQLAWQLSAEKPEAMALYGRLEAARVEVEWLRCSGWIDRGEGLPPEWIEHIAEPPASAPLQGS